MNTLTKVLLGILIFLILIGIIVGYFVFARPYHRFRADFVNDIRQEYIIQDARTRISTYEWFYDQYEQIEALKANLSILEGKEAQGTLLVLNQMIGEYNSKARMDYTRAQWMPTDLPYEIELVTGE